MKYVQCPQQFIFHEDLTNTSSASVLQTLSIQTGYPEHLVAQITDVYPRWQSFCFIVDFFFLSMFTMDSILIKICAERYIYSVQSSAEM